MFVVYFSSITSFSWSILDSIVFFFFFYLMFDDFLGLGYFNFTSLLDRKTYLFFKIGEYSLSYDELIFYRSFFNKSVSLLLAESLTYFDLIKSYCFLLLEATFIGGSILHFLSFILISEFPLFFFFYYGLQID